MKHILLNKQTVRFFGIGVLAAFMISLGIFSQGCSSDFDSDVRIDNLDIPEEYNEVGVLHNEGLEYIFEEIKALGIEYTKNPKLKSRPFMENKDEFIKQATLDFGNQHEKLREHSDMFTHALKDIPSLKSSGIADHSLAVQQLLNEITAVLEQELKENELSRLKIKLDVINQKAATTLSETDAAIIYCATNTSYYSYQYWQENYKKWYFALNYPEILEQYNNEELNQLQLKNGKIRTKGWIGDLFNDVEDWFITTTNSVDEWWDDNGSTILVADGLGAAYGAGKAFVTAGAASLVFGPGGLVVTTAAGGVIGGVEASALGIIGCAIYD